MRAAFTLVEIVIVVLILGILAAVAAPKMFGTSSLAADNSVRQSLGIARAAIDRFVADNGRYPGSDGNVATFKTELGIRPFPKLPVGPTAAQNQEVEMDASTGSPDGANTPTKGWRYYYKSGMFIVNSNDKLNSDKSIRYDEL